MRIIDLTNQLDQVRPRGAGRWSARCPAHPDQSPSLSIREGDHGLLLKCWSGCTIQNICNALGIRVADLFDNAAISRGSRPMPKSMKLDRKALAFRFDLAALDHRLRANNILEAARGIEIASLSEAELDRAIGHIARAHADIERAEVFECVADDLRVKDFLERSVA